MKLSVKKNKNRLINVLGDLHDTDIEPTTEIIYQFFGKNTMPRSFWYSPNRVDPLGWKGKKNQAPTPEEVLTAWGAWTILGNGTNDERQLSRNDEHIMKNIQSWIDSGEHTKEEVEEWVREHGSIV